MSMTGHDAGGDGEAGGDEPAARRPTRRYEARRGAIVRSAVEEMNRKGVRGMTLGDVAARLDLVPTGVIYYFRNKEDLAAAAFLKGVEAYGDLIAAAAGEPTPEARLSAFIRGYFAHARRVDLGEADRLPVFNDVRALNCEPVNDAYVGMYRAFRGLLAGKGDLPRLHRNARAHALLSQVFWICAWQHQAECADFPRTADRMAAILTRGLMAKGAAWPQPKPLDLSRADAPIATSSSEQFLRAATHLINDEGYHGASVERISARLNVSKGAFYHHNETKDELVVACFQRTFDLMWRAIHAAERAGGSGLEVLVSAVSALIEHQMSGAAPLLRTSALTAVPEPIRLGLLQRFDRLSYRLASILCDGIADGSVAPVDVNIASQVISSAINAAAELHYWTPGMAADAVVAHYVRPLFEGLASPAAT
ncbi:MAG: TetR/AcrR family transcriptional regulator [Phenylobacterium sp.]|uniref:TetR/AcrR family transcriptional regulator n=1 Tax=Phenylobacterium sp. TaxID=1871053 RepID=UPI001A3AE13D|nr:TetR/AcrR family transcriptional regulator [Phenylobacterium sp.]MBL8556785.1 TetR/AcrR family transcriptional regulator [Phenylobacterium sp.]